ncbi:MAG: hypothetical protein KKH88_00415 [Nanoarchaeota archaeon]|nr:hypothetical protein [Nanoarchaeota archaeon]
MVILTSGCETYIDGEGESLLSPITCKTYEGTDALCVGAPIGSDNFDQYCPDGYYYHYRKSCYSKKGPIEAVSELPPPRFGPGGNTVNICCMPTVCNDGLDNDGDGDCDLPDSTCDGPFTPGDSGCFDLDDTSETVDCGNGLDDDLDGYCDTIDGECIDGSIPGDESCMDRHGEWNEDIGSEGTACGDWKDNDNDGYCDTTEIITTAPNPEDNECLGLRRGDPGCQINYYNHMIEFMPKVREKSERYACDDGIGNQDGDDGIDYVLGEDVGDPDCQSPFDQYEGDGDATWADNNGVIHANCVDPEEIGLASNPEVDIPFGTVISNNLILCPNEIFDWSNMGVSWGIQVGVDNLIIDCQGSTLLGPRYFGEIAPRDDAGAFRVYSRPVTIKNCIIKGFNQGILLKKAYNSVIENNKFEGNEMGIKLSEGNGISSFKSAEVYENEFVDNNIAGLYSESYSNNENNLVYHNSFTGNGAGIILVGTSDTPTTHFNINNNYIMGNQNAVHVAYGEGITIEKNTLLSLGDQISFDCTDSSGNVGINFCELDQTRTECGGILCEFSESHEAGITELLLHFNGEIGNPLDVVGVTGFEGETPRTGYSISNFEPYSGGVGVRINEGDLLSYNHNNNLNVQEGTLEFIFVPSWDGNDGNHRTFFQDYSGDIGLRLGKFFGSVPIPVDKDYLYFKLQHGEGEYAFWEANTFFNDIVYGTDTIVENWEPNVLHHVRVTWSKNEEFLKFYVDGELVSKIDDWDCPSCEWADNWPEDLSGGYMTIGTDQAGGQAINGIIDEFKISNMVY